MLWSTENILDVFYMCIIRERHINVFVFFLSSFIFYNTSARLLKNTIGGHPIFNRREMRYAALRRGPLRGSAYLFSLRLKIMHCEILLIRCAVLYSVLKLFTGLATAALIAW